MEKDLTKAEQIALWHAARDGDTRAAEQFVLLLTDRALGALRKWTTDIPWLQREDLKDVVQDAWVAWADGKNYDPQQSAPATFFLHLAWHAVCGRVRERKRRCSRYTGAFPIAPTVSETAAWLIPLLLRLDEFERQAFLHRVGLQLRNDVLSECSKKTWEELSRELSCPVITLRRTYERARYKLAKMIEPPDGDKQV